MQGVARVVLVGLVVIVLAGCTPAGEVPEGVSGPSIDLEAIDTESSPEGPSVGELVTVKDFQQALGNDDLTLANST